MLPQRTFEYLFHLSLIILLFKFAVAGTVPAYEDNISENSINAPPASQATSSADTTNAASSSSSSSSSAGGNKRDSIRRAFEECRTQLSWMCLKIEFVKIMERLAERDELVVVPGISVVRNMNATEVKSNDLVADVARSYPNDPNSRLNGYILNKMSNFLQTHYLRFKLIDSETMTEANAAVETGRKGKFGKKGGLEALIAAALMMKGTLMALGMGAVALMAGKALMTALMALTLSSVLGLKSLASGGGGKSTTYEIVSKPVYTSSHSYDEGHSSGGGGGGGGGGHMMGGGHSGSGYGGYGRSLNLVLPKALH